MIQSNIFIPDLKQISGHVKLLRWTKAIGEPVLEGRKIATLAANQQEISIKAPVTGVLTCQFLTSGDTTRNYDISLGKILNLTIPAKCHNDPRPQFQIDFDAVEWFQQATDQKIKDLADCDWHGNGTADDSVASFFRGKSAEVTGLFDYVRDFNLNKEPHEAILEFECSVDEDCAMDWLRLHRVGLFMELNRDSEEGSTSELPIALQNSEQSHVVAASPELRAMGVERVDFSDLVTQLDNLGLTADKPAVPEFNLDESIQSLFRLSAIAANLQESISRQKAELLSSLQQNPSLLLKGKIYEIEQGSIALQTRKQYKIERKTVHDLVSDGMLDSNTLSVLAFPNESVQNAETLKALIGRDLFDESTIESESSEFLVIKPSKVTKNSVAEEIQFWDVMKPGSDDLPWRSIGSEESLLSFSALQKQHIPNTDLWD